MRQKLHNFINQMDFDVKKVEKTTKPRKKCQRKLHKQDGCRQEPQIDNDGRPGRGGGTGERGFAEPGVLKKTKQILLLKR